MRRLRAFEQTRWQNLQADLVTVETNSMKPIINKLKCSRCQEHNTNLQILIEVLRNQYCDSFSIYNLQRLV